MPEYIHVSVAWPYANGDLHLGHVAGTYLPADVFARYHRLRGNRVLMVSGSDMHGTPISVAAERAGVAPRALAEKYHSRIVAAQQALGISYDLFTHTDTENHHRIAQDVFLRLLEKGYLLRKKEKQLYSEAQERFLPDRMVEGTCPRCGYGESRGDQCDGCGRLVDALELVAPRSKLDGSTPVVRETEHFYFDLPAFSEPLRRFLAGGAGRFRRNVLAASRGYLEELRPRAITRDLDWGVGVPVAGWESKRLYVWFEAVIGYLSASVEWASRSGRPDAWERWWYDPGARIYNFLGKDNIPFHSIIWPAELLGVGHLDGEDRGRSFGLPYDIAANEYLNLEGDQFSTSRGRAVWLPEVLEDFEPDAVRYYIASTFPESGDSEFSWDEFRRRVNNELIAAWGNLCHRVLGFAAKRFDGAVPVPGPLAAADETILARSESALVSVGSRLAAVRLRSGLAEAMRVVHEANAYVTVREPWKRLASDPADAATSIYTILRVIDNLKVVLSPFLPFSCERLHGILGHAGRLFGDLRIETSPERERVHQVLAYDGGEATGRWRPSELQPGQRLGRVEPLYTKLEVPEMV